MHFLSRQTTSQDILRVPFLAKLETAIGLTNLVLHPSTSWIRVSILKDTAPPAILPFFARVFITNVPIVFSWENYLRAAKTDLKFSSDVSSFSSIRVFFIRRNFTFCSSFSSTTAVEPPVLISHIRIFSFAILFCQKLTTTLFLSQYIWLNRIGSKGLIAGGWLAIFSCCMHF